ncbi:unnamed protein product, partial [Ectocarpus sp. 8 AP-2014]
NGSCRESCGESDVTITIVGDAVDLVRLVPFGGPTRDTSVGVGRQMDDIRVVLLLCYDAVVLTSVSNHRGKVSRSLLPIELGTFFGSRASLLNPSQTQVLLCNELRDCFWQPICNLCRKIRHRLFPQSSGMYCCCRWI